MAAPSLDQMKSDLLKAADYLKTVPKPTQPPALPPTINSSNIAPVPPLPYATPTPVPAYPVSALDPSVPTPPATPTASETAAQDVISTLKDLNNSMVDKTGYQAQQDAAAGVDVAQKAVTDLSARLTGLQNEALAIPLQLQNESAGRGITAAGLAPIESARKRNNAIEALTVSTLLEAVKGNLANAQAKADRAVEQKYGPIQARIDAAKSNLDLILKSPEASLEDKNRAQARLDIENARQRALDKLKEDASGVFKVASEAAANGADAVTLEKIAAAKTPAEALRLASASGVAQKVDTQIIETNGRKLLIDAKTGKTIKDLGAAPVSGSGDRTTEAERQAAKLNAYSAAFVPGAKMPNGVPVLDSDGYLTPEAFRAAVSDYGDRASFIKQYGYLLTTPDGKISPKYGLTPVEIKLATGVLPGE